MTREWPVLLGLLGLMVPPVLPPQAHGQEVWRHVDGQGHIRYADRPFPGAVRMEPPAVTGWLARAGPPSESLPPRNEPQAAAAASAPALEIAYPAAGDTVWGAGGELEVRLAIGGDIKDVARISIRLDGAEASWQGEPPVLRLKEVWRGEHRLQARLLDALGGELAVSEEVRFFKREPSVPVVQSR